MNKITQSEKRGTYNTYSSELKRIVSETGNIDLAIKRGVPRTTAIYWVNYSKRISLEVSDSEKIYQEEIEVLNADLEKERAKVQFISSISKYIYVVRSGKKRTPLKIKRIIVNEVLDYLKYCSLKELLKLIGISSNRYYKWKSSLKRCSITGIFECASKRSNQLTGEEVFNIIKMASSKRYYHFSLTSLWKFCIRNEIFYCSRETWFKYINMFGVERPKRLLQRKKYSEGIRASKPGEIFHIDMSILKLGDGSKLYFQVIIDNYSRFVTNWSLNSDKRAKNTKNLIFSLKEKINLKNAQIMMDKGTENINSSINLVLGNNLKRIIAKQDVRFSNSMVEAFFRSIKNNFLYKNKYDDFKDLKRAISFYVDEYNNKIPHNAFKWETPKEAFEGKIVDSIDVLQSKKEAFIKRQEVNQRLKKCKSCLAV